jgi:hypothetical protein
MFVPQKADEVLSKQEQQTIKQYINRQVSHTCKAISLAVPAIAQSLRAVQLRHALGCWGMVT